jgi:nicotinamide mononucleotide transporter
MISALEILAVIAGTISVTLTINLNKYCWLFGVISCVLLSIYFYNVHFYGQMILQIVSIGQSVYGWVRWNKIDNKEVTRIGFINSGLLIFMCAFLGMLFTDITQPNHNYWYYLDGAGGVIALLATYLLVLKKIEAWWIYMINNVLIFILCVHQGIYYISILNLFYFIISIKGYKEWQKNIKTV